MRLLVDSCVLVWWLGDPASLSREAREAIQNPEHDVLFSAASVWELGLKIQKGKLRLPASFPRLLVEDGFTTLSVTVGHAERSLTLPAEHRDPFDRLLIAQALTEGLVLVTRDSIIQRYPLPVIVA